jgi:hypothetical protein
MPEYHEVLYKRQIGLGINTENRHFRALLYKKLKRVFGYLCRFFMLKFSLLKINRKLTK